MSAVKHQPGSPLPFKADEVLVLLGANAGGFSLFHCPHPEQLAAYIAHAANAYPKLVLMLKTAELQYHESSGFAAEISALLRDLGEQP